MVKLWMLKGPLMFYLSSMVLFVLHPSFLTEMSRGMIVFILTVGPLIAVPTFMPTQAKGTD